MIPGARALSDGAIDDLVRAVLLSWHSAMPKPSERYP